MLRIASLLALVACGSPRAHDTPPDAAAPSDAPGMPSSAVDVGVGTTHACALLADHTVHCWGANTFAQLGYDTKATCGALPTVPARCEQPRAGLVAGLPAATGLAVGFAHSCALLSDGTVRCWGSGGQRELGAEVSGDPLCGECSLAPVTVVQEAGGAPLDNAVAIAAGNGYGCALRTAGAAHEVWCWGANWYAQLGVTASPSHLAIRVPFPEPIDPVALYVANASTCVRDAQGAMWCWGEDVYGQLGVPATHHCVDDATLDCIPSPQRISLPADAVLDRLVLGATSCAPTTAGQVYCWGSNFYGELGRATGPFPLEIPPMDASPTPGLVQAAPGSSLSGVTGLFGTCALVGSPSKLQCWGSNLDWNLARDDYRGADRPVDAIGASSLAIARVVGANTRCAVTDDQQIACWGRDTSSELGSDLGDFTNAEALYVQGLAASDPPSTLTMIGPDEPAMVDVPAGATRYFKIQIATEVTQVRIEMTGGTGDCDLLEKAHFHPTATDFDDRSQHPGNAESIAVSNIQYGPTYIAATTQGGCAGATLVVTTTMTPIR